MRSAKQVPAKKTPRTGFAITMELSAEMVANCLCSAFEGGGSRYWCSIRREVAPRGELAFRSSDKQIIPFIGNRGIDVAQDGGGGAVSLEDSEAEDEKGKPKRYRLTRTALRRGLAVMAADYPRHFANLVGEMMSDAETGDVLLQCSVLGEVRYG